MAALTWNPYRRTTASVDYYNHSGGSSGRSEVDVRQELVNTFLGVNPEISKAQTGLLRRVRRDSNDKVIPCACVDPVTKNWDKDRLCVYCMGAGVYWDETGIQFYRTLEGPDLKNALRDRLTAAGLINIPSVVFYIRYDAVLSRGDWIVELVLDVEGDPVIPRKRRRLFRINTAMDYRADNGRLEYWKIFAHEEEVKYLNAPSYENV